MPFQKKEIEGTLMNSFCKGSITWIPESDEDILELQTLLPNKYRWKVFPNKTPFKIKG